MGMFLYVQVQVCVHTCKGQRSSTFVLGRGHRYHPGTVEVREQGVGASSLLPQCEFRRLNSGPPAEHLHRWPTTLFFEIRSFTVLKRTKLSRLTAQWATGKHAVH